MKPIIPPKEELIEGLDFRYKPSSFQFYLEALLIISLVFLLISEKYNKSVVKANKQNCCCYIK